MAAPFSHDSSAALVVDGKVVAAAEEERFTRKKHDGNFPVHSVNFCLKQAGLTPSDIDYIAFPWSIDILRERKWEYFFKTVRTRFSPAFKKLYRNQKELQDKVSFIHQTLEACGFDISSVKVKWVEHQLAHVASSYYLSGMKDAAVMSIDAGGEITSTLLGQTQKGNIQKIKEIVSADSLGAFYATMTDYLGFDRGEGEYKVMGMAPFGDSKKVNFDQIIWWDEKKKTFRTNEKYVWVTRDKRFKVDKMYSKQMVDEFGPERAGDALSDPYIHIAAATQKKLEEIAVNLVETYLKESLTRHGNLCFAGGCALNVSLNRILLDLPYVKKLWVQPAAHDTGTSLGAAVYVAHQMGESIAPMDNAYLGPEFSNHEIENELKQWPFAYTLEKDICRTACDLLDQKHVIGWFQGKMEWGPRALGNRSILGNPTVKGTADKINAIIKFREQWRPFCPSILREHANEILNSSHDAPYMTIAFKVNDVWKEKIPEVVHIDGTARPQLVDQKSNPRYYQLIQNFYEKTGIPVLINTSLNRRGEPMICSPKDALKMFEGCGLDYMVMGDYLVRKEK